MPDPEPDQTPTITVPTSATAPAPATEPVDTPPASNGSQATTPAVQPTAPTPEPRPQEHVVPPPPPTSTVIPRTSPPTTAPPPPASPSRSRSVTAVGSRFVVIHPHVSYFGWLADKQGPPDATPEERLNRYRADSPGLFRVCVILDLLVMFVITGVLVAALAAVLFKAIFGVI